MPLNNPQRLLCCKRPTNQKKSNGRYKRDGKCKDNRKEKRREYFKIRFGGRERVGGAKDKEKEYDDN